MSYDDDKQSRFNAGVALAERIDSLQRAINAARFNPIAFNPATGTFNYQVMISSNEGLLNEAWAKLNAVEKQKGSRVSLLVKAYADVFPPIVKVNETVIVKKDNLKKIMDLLDIYEKMNKEFLDNHSLNSPNQEDDDGL